MYLKGVQSNGPQRIEVYLVEEMPERANTLACKGFVSSVTLWR